MDRNGLIKHVGDWTQRLGSQSKVADKCGISGTALSQWLSGKYGADTAAMDQKIAKSLDYHANQWVTVPSISNYKQIQTVFNSAKAESMWFAISNKAGSGKTETLQDLFNADKTGSIVLIQAEEWTARQFLSKIIEKTSGVTLKGYQSISQLTDAVVSYFNGLSLQSPVLLIDEADKLKPSALRVLIPLYNRTEHRLGVVLSGTENLEKEIKKGVELRRKGFDELDSRLGRSFIHLRGASEADVKAICTANGVVEIERQNHVWYNLDKVKKQVKVGTKTGEKDVILEFVEDLRRLMRLIKSELITKRLKAA